MRPALLCLSLAPLPAPLAAEVAYDPARFAIELGVFCDVPSVGEVEAPGTAAGKIELFDAMPEFQWRTDVVPAVPDVSFGVKSSAIDGQLYDGVILSLEHPPFRESGHTRQAYVTELGGSSTSINAYTFDLPEERVPGLWIIRAEREGELLYEARFQVVPAELAPEIAAVCGGLPLS